MRRANAPCASWLVFGDHVEQDAHAAHFASFDRAEDFANDLRVASTLCVSEPMPVMVTNDLRMTIPG